MAERVNFTKEFIRSINPPGKGRRYIYDKQVPKLCLCITAKGTMTWYRYGRVDGRPQRYRIGSVQEFSIKQARDECERINGEVASRRDPMELKRSRRESKTLGEAFAWFLEHYSKVNKKSWQKDQKKFKNHLKHWENRRLSSLTTTEIQEHHTRTINSPKSGPAAANHWCKLLSQIYKQAIRNGWVDSNPVEGVRLAQLPDRERFLSPDEILKWFSALETLQRQATRDFFLLCLYTGARRGNVSSMRWEELDLENGVWTIPGNKFKNKRAVSIVLVKQSIEILERRQDETDSEWVFPSTRSRSGHYNEPKTAWANLCERAELTDVRLHDLRRTLGSWQAVGGSSLPIIGKSLGHRSVSATQVYARLHLDSVRASVSAAVDAIEAAQKKSQK